MNGCKVNEACTYDHVPVVVCLSNMGSIVSSFSDFAFFQESMNEMSLKLSAMSRTGGDH